jgi:hypothetical protein
VPRFWDAPGAIITGPSKLQVNRSLRSAPLDAATSSGSSGPSGSQPIGSPAISNRSATWRARSPQASPRMLMMALQSDCARAVG